MNKNYHFQKGIAFLAVICLFLSLYSCGNKAEEEFYTEADFNKVNKIDIHSHVKSEKPYYMDQAIDDNFRILTVNVDAGGAITQQQENALFQREAFPNRLAYVTTFDMEGWENDDWQEKTLAYLKDSFQKGAIGVKVWKNIGMVEKDKNGKFIMIDNPGFDPIFNYLEENGIPLIGHLGEPKNCWLPLDEMTVNNDRKYFADNPQYHMYLHPEHPSYEEQIAARDRRLEKHPELIFIGAHLASLEWSVDKMGEFFERFPLATAEMAARLCHIQVQAQDDWQKVRNFFIKYQDRIIYGTDLGSGNMDDPEDFKQKVHEQWMSDWKFLTGNENISSWKVDGEFKGLNLPQRVVNKIYYENAERVFPELKRIKDQEIQN